MTELMSLDIYRQFGLLTFFSEEVKVDLGLDLGHQGKMDFYSLGIFILI